MGLSAGLWQGLGLHHMLTYFLVSNSHQLVNWGYSFLSLYHQVEDKSWNLVDAKEMLTT